MQSYRERLITTAASMAINMLADQAVAKTEEARRELGNQAYTLLEYALVPDSVRGELPATPEIELMLEEVATLDNKIPIERVDYSELHTKVLAEHDAIVLESAAKHLEDFFSNTVGFAVVAIRNMAAARRIGTWKPKF